MVKVTMTTGESAPAPEKAKIKLFAGVDVTDASGRVITIGKPKPLDNLDFAKAAGGDGEINKVYLAEVFHLKFVRAIDGAKVATPATEGELRALYSRLDDDGNEAVQAGVMKHFLAENHSDRDELGNS
jgi:hypothetical protein